MPSRDLYPRRSARAYPATHPTGAKPYFPQSKNPAVKKTASIPDRIHICALGFSCPAYWLEDMGRSPVTASAEQHRLTAGTNSSIRKSAPSEAAEKNANWLSISRHSPITAKEPTWESFRIARRFSRSRQDFTASVTSMNPSRWMNPVRRKGHAHSASPPTSAGSFKKRTAQASAAQTNPISSPTTGRNRSIFPLAFSSQSRPGNGIAQNMDWHMAKAQR